MDIFPIPNGVEIVLNSDNKTHEIQLFEGEKQIGTLLVTVDDVHHTIKIESI